MILPEPNYRTPESFIKLICGDEVLTMEDGIIIPRSIKGKSTLYYYVEGQNVLIECKRNTIKYFLNGRKTTPFYLKMKISDFTQSKGIMLWNRLLSEDELVILYEIHKIK